MRIARFTSKGIMVDQDQILKDLKNGAKLQCTEGSDYKAWLVYPDGTERKVRRNSAEKVCNENESLLIFGRPDGIAHRKAVQTGSSVAAGVRVSEERKMKNILIELGDEELKLVSQKELDEIIKSDEEFDGFHGWTLKGRLTTNGNTAEKKEPCEHDFESVAAVKCEHCGMIIED